ncbi:MAG: hypothetical protein KKF46_06070 [Nanoarchaeota archaeon]|nr:hypothetical protein [Nanoarchaeota archaeon]MBU1321899.1 hypothetical protein [Nanoarchaeota archaeon]MBU1597674.1 hypothetical protein [Nanoarchaeota archaeon]MBU2442237.1 hypothetical protein [Nanoarchaeota archaeon]
MAISKNNLLVLKHLRENARKSFSSISRKTKIPVTTVYDNYHRLSKNQVITKHTSLLDFKKLGFHYRSFVFVKAKKRYELLSYLKSHNNVNSIYRIGGFDYMLDTIFPTIKEHHEFLETLRDFDLLRLECHDVIDHMKKEEFLSE